VLVHDLSLNNIVITSDGRIVLAGLSRPLPENLLSAAPAELAFAAPERLSGGQVDTRSDVYALGVLLYTLVAGRLPFAGAAGGILGQKQAAASLPPLDDPRSELPCAYTLVHVMRQATAREPGMRYANVAAFREAFVGALNGPAKLTLLPRISYDIQRRAQLRRHTRAAPRRTAHQPYEQMQVSITLGAPVTLASVEPVIVLDEDMRHTPTLTRPLADIPPHRSAPSAADFTAIVSAEGSAPPAPVHVAGAAEMAAPPAQVPGSDRPELQVALPFTVLVPMGEGNTADVAPKAPIERSVGSALTANLWLIAMFALGAIAVGVAVALG
jgi:serine/threonine-protein kinase